MFDSFQSQLGKLLGKRDDDPQSTITADQLKVVLKSIEGKYNNLKNENKLFKSKIEEQKSTIAELEKALSEVKGGGGADAGLLTQLEGELDAVRNQLSEQREQVDGLRAEKLQLQSKLSVQEALVSSLRHELSEAREGAASAVAPEDYAKAVTEADRLRAERDQLQGKVQELAAKVVAAEELEEDLREARSALQKANDELTAMGESRASAEAAKTELEGRLVAEREAQENKFEAERQALMARLEQLTEELDQARTEFHGVEGERQKLTETQSTLEAQLATAQEERARVEELLAALQMDKEELQHQLQKQHEELASGGPAQEVLEALETRFMEARARSEQLAEENELLKSRLQQLLEEPTGLGAREKTELEFQIKRLSDELREAGAQITSLREAKVKSALDLEEAASELVELRRQLDDMRRDRNFYRERWEDAREAQTEVDHIKNQVHDLVQEVSRLRGEPQAPVRRPAAIQPPRPETHEAPRPAIPPEPPAAKPAPTAEIPGGSLARRREMLNRLIGEKKDK